jgi:GntR family transcriptional regulator/MocR family aminotransferase
MAWKLRRPVQPKPAGTKMIPLQIEGSAGTTLQTQLYDQIRRAIFLGSLLPGTALPSSRELARVMKLSRNTVVLAYEKLAQEGYLAMRCGAGTFVADPLPEAYGDAIPLNGGASAGDADAEADSILAGPNYPPVLLQPGVLRMVQNGPSDHEINFWYGSANCRNFPLREWRQLLIENLSRASTNISGYGPPEGILELRQAIAAHVSNNRAIPIDADQVVVTAGTQEALNLVSRLFVQSSVRVAIENPCYLGAALVFRSYGGTLVPLPVDESGARTDALDGCGASLIYVTPSHQFPTGATMSARRRFELLRWAQKNGAYIIEDDYDSDFRYDGPPLAALAGLNRNSSVIYLGTFSKSVGPGLRTGYAVVPKQLIEPMRHAKGLANYGHPWIEQIVLADFINNGGFARHLRRIRQSYGQTRDALLECMQEQFGPVEVHGSDAGMHIMWTLPPFCPSASEVAGIAASEGVGVYTIEKVGAHEIGPSRYKRALVLGYALLSPAQAREGIFRIARGLDRAGIARAPSSFGGSPFHRAVRMGTSHLKVL